jgi:hypothetical protein
MFMKEEEQDHEEFEWPELGQGKCSHHLIILLLYIYNSFTFIALSNIAKRKGLTSPILYSLYCLGF